jgi:hypothetical protein
MAKHRADGERPRVLRSSTWPVPGILRLSADRQWLEFTYNDNYWTGEEVAITRGGKTHVEQVFPAFPNLARLPEDVLPERVLAFARTFGILQGIDVEPLPRAPRGVPSGRQPIEAWRRLAVWADSIRFLSSYLSLGELPEPIQWDARWREAYRNSYQPGAPGRWRGDVAPNWVWWTGNSTGSVNVAAKLAEFGLDPSLSGLTKLGKEVSRATALIALGRAEIATMLNLWVAASKPTLVCQWKYGPEPLNINFSGHSLMAALATNLIADVAGARYLAICHECTRLYTATRRPAPGRNHYCEDHRHLANKNALHEARERQRLEKLAAASSKSPAPRKGVRTKKKGKSLDKRSTGNEVKASTAAAKRPDGEK